MAKTLKQIEKRLQAYKAGTADSPYRIVSPTSYDRDFGTMEPGAIDADRYYHAQCADLIIDYMVWLTDGKYRPQGNAKDYPYMSFPESTGFKVHRNLPSTQPKTGWIAVFTTGNFAKWGHIGIVYSPGNTTAFTIIEQNWNGYANKKPTTRKDYYTGLTHFIEVPYAKSKASATKKKTAKKTKKAKKLKYDRKSIARKSYLGKRGYKPKGVVIHNDAGSASATQYKNQLVNASNARLERGIAHSYISGNTVWQALPESYIAWHTADATGNKNYYGIEVCQSFSASDKEFLASEQSVFQETARLLKKWKLPVNRSTVRLHNEFSSTQCPHRSLALHAGYTSTQLAPQNVINKVKDYFISQIKAYYDGEIPAGTTAPSTSTTPAKPVAVSGGWKKNAYGTYYKAENGTFTCGNQPIQVRTIGPFLSTPKAYMFQPGGYTPYDEVMLQDGFVWIGYYWQNTRYYLPVRTWNGKAPGNGYSSGPEWGKFS